MAFFYVKNSLGTRTSGGGLTQQTGSFADLGASSVYAKVTDAIADGAGDGDVICVSDAHAYSVDGEIAYAGPGTAGQLLTLVSVSDGACDVYTPATAIQEEASGTFNDMVLDGQFALHGVSLKGFAFAFEGFTTKEQALFARDCTLANNIEFTASTRARLENCALGGMVWPSQALIEIYGGSIVDSQAALFMGGTPRADIVLDGVDLSGFTSHLIDHAWDQSLSNVSPIRIDIRNCALAAGVSFLEAAVSYPEAFVTVLGSASTVAEAAHQYYHETYQATVQANTSAYRQGSVPFESDDLVSLEVATKAPVSVGRPYTVSLPLRFVDLSATGTLRLYLASTVTLTDKDVWAVVVYQDDTGATRHYQATNPEVVFGASTALTADAGSDWRDGGAALSGYAEYYIDVDTSGTPGGEGVPTVLVSIAVPSITVLLDPAVEGM